MPAAAVPAQHVRERDLGVGLGDAGRVEPHRRPPVVRLDAPSRLDLVEDRLRHGVARAERVGELVAVTVQEHGAVGPRRLRDRVPLHRRGPRAAVRVVLERIEVASLGPGVERDAGGLARRVRVVRRELAARRGLREAAAAGGEHHGRRLDVVGALRRLEGRVPPGRRRLEGGQPVMREHRAFPRLEAVAERLRDRMPRPVADLEEALARRAAAPRQPVAAVLAREPAAELLEPGDRARRLGREHVDEHAVGGLVRGAHDVLGVELRRVVVAECRLDATLRLRRVVRLKRRLRRDPDARARPLGGHGRGEPCGAAADHEHVEGRAGGHAPDRTVIDDSANVVD